MWYQYDFLYRNHNFSCTDLSEGGVIKFSILSTNSKLIKFSTLSTNSKLIKFSALSTNSKLIKMMNDLVAD